ncbi:MAG TPA: CopD family protein [Kofleriaceae bacterium]|nr:CopD family protein [Kofleriaceae bacterium]
MSAHLIAIVLWISGLTVIYWLLRLHDHVPKDTRDKLTLMERSVALMADIAAAVAIGCGIAMAVSPINLFTAKDGPWLHIKLTVVVVAILSVHGMLRARIKKFSRGQITPVPGWMWSLLLAGMTISILLATTKLHFLK